MSVGPKRRSDYLTIVTVRMTYQIHLVRPSGWRELGVSDKTFTEVYKAALSLLLPKVQSESLGSPTHDPSTSFTALITR